MTIIDPNFNHVHPHTAAELRTQLEAAALTARNLLHVANRELLENLEQGLAVVSTAERYVTDVLLINAQLCAVYAARVTDKTR